LVLVVNMMHEGVSSHPMYVMSSTKHCYDTIWNHVRVSGCAGLQASTALLVWIDWIHTVESVVT